MFSNLTISDVVTVIISLLVAMTVHEFMHAYVGFKLGDTTAMEKGRVSFNPLHHIDPVMSVLLPAITLILFHFPFLSAKPVPFDPRRVRYGEYGSAMLAVAGPLSNLVMAVLAAVVLHLTGLSSGVQNVLLIFLQINVALFVFNILPIPPLDGSRVLYAFAPEPLQEVMERIEPYGFLLILALVLSGVLTNLLIFLNSFVLNLLP